MRITNLHRGVETERFCRGRPLLASSSALSTLMVFFLTVQEGAQVLHVANVIVRRPARKTNMLGDLIAQTLQDVLMLAQQVNAKRESSCGLLSGVNHDQHEWASHPHRHWEKTHSVPSGQQDVKRLVV